MRNTTMRTIVVLLVIVLILGLVGWLQFSSDGGDPTIRLDTDKVKDDTAEIYEKSKDAVGAAADKIDDSIE